MNIDSSIKISLHPSTLTDAPLLRYWDTKNCPLNIDAAEETHYLGETGPGYRAIDI